MSNVLNLINHGTPRAPERFINAQIVGPLPSTFSDILVVQIRETGAIRTIQPGFWGACNGRTLPQVGNACLLIIDHLGVPWVPQWVASTVQFGGPR